MYEFSSNHFPSPPTHTHVHPSPLTGVIPWLMVTELFLQEARPVAVTIATIANWLGNFAVALAFPYILVRRREGKGRGKGLRRGGDS